MTFEIDQDRSAHGRWRPRATDGKVLADSGEGSSRRIDCRHGIDAVKASAFAEVPGTGTTSEAPGT